MDGQPLPPELDAPLIHFETDRGARLRRLQPVHRAGPGDRAGQIDIGAAAAERKACPPPQMELEQKFLKQLDAVSGYGYQAGQLALTWQDGERTGMLLLRK